MHLYTSTLYSSRLLSLARHLAKAKACICQGDNLLFCSGGDVSIDFRVKYCFSLN